MTPSTPHVAYTTGTANGATYVIATRTDQASTSATDVLTSISKYYREDVGDDLYRNQPYAQIRPDGSKSSYLRLQGNWDPVNKAFILNGLGGASLIGVINGSASALSGATAQAAYQGHTIDNIWVIPGRSMLELVTRDERNRVVRTESQVWDGSSWKTVNWVNFAYDWSNRLIAKLSSNGDTYEAHYSAGVKNYEIDGTGTKVSYTYDDADRVKTSTKEGIKNPSEGGNNQPDLITEYTYDSVDHIVRQDTYAVGQTEKLTTSRTYDLAGRLTSETVPSSAILNVAPADAPPAAVAATTNYTYGINSSGGRVTTATLSDTSTRIQTTYLDGQLCSQTGTGVLSEFMTYTVRSDGTRVTTRSPVLTGLPRYTKITKDWLGRTSEIERPGFTGQPALIERNTYQPVTGLLIKTERGIAPTLYEYDSVGQLVRSGLDVNRNGVLDLAGMDRIVGQERIFASEGDAWWLITSGYTYAQASALRVTTGITRERLSGFTGDLRAETRSTDVEGNTTRQTITVDPTAKLVKSTTAVPGVSLPQVDEVLNGLPIETRTTDGLTVKASYDGLQRPNSVEDSRHNKVTTAYYPGTVLPYSRTAAWATDVVVATYGYDLMGRTVWTRNADNHYARVAYNKLGQVTSQWGEATYPASYDYTDYGERQHLYTYQTDSGFTGETWPSSAIVASTTQWDYDGPSGLLLKKTIKKADNSDPSVRYDYNALGQVLHRFWARTLDGTANTAPVTTTYGYDPNTAELRSTSYNDGTPSVATTYNRLGQPLTVSDATVSDAATGTRTFLWAADAPWRLNGERLPDFYQNRLLSRLYENGTDASSGKVKGRAFGFQLGTVLNPAAYLEQTMRMDSKARVAGLSSGRDNGTITQSFSYGYVADSRLLGTLSATGTGFSLSRNYENRRDLLDEITGTWAGTTRSKFTYINGNLGERQTVTQDGDAFADYGNDLIKQNFRYNARGELTSAGAYMGAVAYTPDRKLPGRQFEFSYDEIGNRKSASHAIPDSGQEAPTESFESNELNQLQARENKSISVSGTAVPDAKVVIGTPSGTSLATREGSFWQSEVSLAVSARPVATQIDVVAAKPGSGAAADLVQVDRRYIFTGRATEVITYDDDGNLKSDDHWLYKWDAENRLISMQANPWTATAHGPARQKLEFKYDYLSRRVSKKISNWVTGAETSGWIEQSVRKFVYDGWNLIAETDGDGNLMRSYTWGLDPSGSWGRVNTAGSLVQITDHITKQSYFPTYDGNGNVAALIRAQDGIVAASYEYGPFGESLRQSGFYATSNPFRFSSKYTDSESGLIYYGYRYYEPRNGRFINRDSIEESGGLNLYGFVGNDSINREDFLGMNYSDYEWRQTLRLDSVDIGVDAYGSFHGGNQLTPDIVNNGSRGGGNSTVTFNDSSSWEGNKVPYNLRFQSGPPTAAEVKVSGGFKASDSPARASAGQSNTIFAPNKSPYAQLAAQRDKLRAQLGASNSAITRANGDLIGATNGAVEGSTLDQVNQFAERMDASSQGMDVILTAASEMNLRTAGRAVDHFSSGFSSITIGAGFGFGVSDIQNGNYTEGASQIVGSGIGAASLIGGRLATDGIISKAAGGVLRAGGLAASVAQVALFFGQELYAGVAHSNDLRNQQKTIEQLQGRADKQLSQLKDVYSAMKADEYK